LLGTNTLTVRLTNLLSNIANAGQAISDLSWVLSNGATRVTGGTLTTGLGLERSINDNVNTGPNGGYTDGAIEPIGWGFTAETASAPYHLDDLVNGLSPAHTLVGPPGPNDIYSAANPSVTNDPHNPHLAGTIAWTFAISGVTADTSVTGVSFSFGTTSGVTSSGVCVSGCGGGGGTGQEVVPEPLTMLLSGGGLVLLGLLRRRSTATRSRT